MFLRIAYAVAVFVVFGVVSVAMGRSTLRDLREHRDERDRWMMALDIYELRVSLLAALIAIGCPIAILAWG